MKKLALFGLSAVLMGLFTVTAYASIPASNGTINGCYKTTSGPGPVPAGQLVVIDSAGTCPTGYAPLNWNQTGPQGPAGLVSQASFTNLNQVNVPVNVYTNVASVTISLPSDETVEIQFSAQRRAADVRFRITVDGNPIVNPNPPDTNSPNALVYPGGDDTPTTNVVTTTMTAGSHVVNLDAYFFCSGCSSDRTSPIGPTSLIVLGLGS